MVLLMLLLPAACSPLHASAPMPQGGTVIRDSQLRELVQNAVVRQQKCYPFTLQIPGSHLPILKGSQMGTNWMLRDESGNTMLKRDGSQISSHIGKHDEVMTVEQAGVISPEDHLNLIREMAGSIRKLGERGEGAGRLWEVEVTIDPARLEKRILSRFTKQESKGIGFHIGQQMDVRYRLFVYPQTHELKRMALEIGALGHSTQTVLIYDFR
jgi:hypothetical protein